MTDTAQFERSTLADRTPAERTRSAVVGAGLASLVIGTWLALHIFAVFFFSWNGLATGGASAAQTLGGAALIVAVQCWLYVGLFIVAHDAMHGSLTPGWRAANVWFGRVTLLIYAGFSFDHLVTKHRDHHVHSGTGRDPDFHDGEHRGFWRWYAKFFMEYFSGREFALIFATVLIYYFALGAPLVNIWVFWALPALLSSVQLFAFGTYLPHRPADDPFSDHHNARSNGYSWLWSLLTCFHFGYHHEHHLFPHVPWWRLPRARRNLASLTGN